MTVSLMLIARALVMRPLSGGLEDPLNITLLVSIIATIIIQFGMGFGLGGQIAQHDLNWPWVLIHAGALFAARLVGPALRNPLVLWLGIYVTLMFIIHAITAEGPVNPPRAGAGSIWIALQAASAIIALAIAGRGFAGPSPAPSTSQPSSSSSSPPGSKPSPTTPASTPTPWAPTTSTGPGPW